MPELIFEDSFAGTANLFIEDRIPTALADDSPRTDGVKWASAKGGTMFLTGSGIARSMHDPIAGAYLYPKTPRPASRNYTAEVFIQNTGGGSAGVSIDVDPDSGNALHIVVGSTPFGPNKVLFYLEKNGGEGFPFNADLPVNYNGGVPARLKVTSSQAGSVHHIKAEFALGSDAYVTVADEDLSPSDTLPRAGWPGIFSQTADGANLSGFRAIYTPGSEVEPTTGIGKMLVVGDSNNEFVTSLGSNLGNLVARKIESDEGYNRITVFSRAISGTTTQDWAEGNTGFFAQATAAARMTIRTNSIKVVIDSLGTNDGKLSVATSKAVYKARTLARIAGYKAEGATKILLVTPAAVNETTAGSDWVGSNARFAEYGAANNEIAAADSAVTVCSDLLSFFTANQGTTFLPDGVHYSLGTAGAPAARDKVAASLSPLILSQYPLLAPPTTPPTGGTNLPIMSTRPTNKGEISFKSQFLQLVAESEPGQYDPAGERFALTCLTGDFQPDEAWDSFRPDGVNEDAWHALSREHRIYTASISWDYAQQLTLARLLFGEGATTSTQPVGTVEQIFALGGSDARPIRTFTLEWGTLGSCERCPYALLTTISRSHDRDGAGKVDGQLTILCRKPIAYDVPMSGLSPQNAVVQVMASGVTDGGVFAVTRPGAAVQNVTFSPGDTTPQTVAKLAAIGVTATVSGTVAVTPGEVHTLTATGTYQAATFYGVISIPADTSAGQLQSSIRALGGVYAGVVVTRISTTGTSDSGIFLIAFPVGVGDVPDITSTPGVGWTSSVTPAGSSVGDIAITVTAPANAYVTLSKISGAGWSSALTQAGSNGKITIAKRLPVLNQHFGVRISDTRAGLDTAPLVGRAKMTGWSIDALAEPVWFASEGETTFQSHTDDPEGRKISVPLRLGASSPLVATLAAYKAESPSRPFWIEVKSNYGDGLHLDKWQALVSVSEARKRVAAGKILAWDYTLTTVLADQPFNADAVADGGASFYAILRKAA